MWHRRPFVRGSESLGGLEEIVPFTAGGRLEIASYMGTISILPWDREELEVKAAIAGPRWLGQRHRRRAAAATRIALTGDRGRRRLEPDFSAVPVAGRGPHRALPEVHFALRAPRDLSLYLRDRKSRIHLEGLAGEFDVHTHRGTVTARELAGRWLGATGRGSIQLDRFRGRFDLSSVRGEIDLVAVIMEGDSRLATTRGSVLLTFARPQGFALHADLRPQARLVARGGGQALDCRSRQLDVDIGGGGPRLAAESSRGTIRVLA
jgi:hypothetical protein